jgi:hypothetical protein
MCEQEDCRLAPRRPFAFDFNARQTLVLEAKINQSIAPNSCLGSFHEVLFQKTAFASATYAWHKMVCRLWGGVALDSLTWTFTMQPNHRSSM